MVGVTIRRDRSRSDGRIHLCRQQRVALLLDVGTHAAEARWREPFDGPMTVSSAHPDVVCTQEGYERVGSSTETGRERLCYEPERKIYRAASDADQAYVGHTDGHLAAMPLT